MNRFLTSAVIGSTVSLSLLLFPSTASADPVDDFYNSPVSDLAEHTDGDIVRTLGVDQQAGAHSQRILYKSTDNHGTPMVVSGYTVTPDAPWTGPGRRPVVAYAPGTSGLGDQCAGSHGIGTSQDYMTFTPLLARGYEVVATDYRGLGTPGGHTYLNRVDGGNALLDAARAAVGNTDDPKTPVMLYGYSEGGNAAAAAAELSATHAPDLNLKGTYAGAPPGDFTLNIDNLDGTALAGDLLYGVDGLINAYPEQADAIRAMFNDRGRTALDESQNYCVADSNAFSGMNTREITNDGRSIKEHLADEPAASLLEENTLGSVAPAEPVLVIHGVNDDTVPVAQGRTLVKRWNDAGANSITYREYDFPMLPVVGLNHMPAAFQAYPDVVQWMDGLIRG